MAKRLLDLLGAGLGLLLLAPLLVLVALAIKADSPVPVFYRQVRVGRGGREFRIHKFRTMTHDPAGRGPQLTVGADARITRVGAVLRRTKLDELPPLLYGIIMLETEIDATGQVVNVSVVLKPAADEVAPWVLAMVRRAAPYPAPAAMPGATVRFTETWFVDRSGLFQLFSRPKASARRPSQRCQALTRRFSQGISAPTAGSFSYSSSAASQ